MLLLWRILLCLWCLSTTLAADDDYQVDYNEYDNDQYQQYDNKYRNNDDAAKYANDDITYWTDYAILPKRCIV